MRSAYCTRRRALTFEWKDALLETPIVLCEAPGSKHVLARCRTFCTNPWLEKTPTPPPSPRSSISAGLDLRYYESAVQVCLHNSPEICQRLMQQGSWPSHPSIVDQAKQRPPLQRLLHLQLHPWSGNSTQQTPDCR